MDRLALIYKAYNDNIINKRIYDQICKREKYIQEGIARIERASNIKYPECYIEPDMLLARSSLGESAILFARTIPIIIDNKVSIIIQLSAPLVVFGLRWSIHAILAHEFLHYLELLSRIIDMSIISDEIAYTIFESKYSDQTRLLNPRAVFNSRSLIRLLATKFSDGFNDKRLEERCIDEWLNKGYPTKMIDIEYNTIKLPVEAIINTKIDKELEAYLKSILIRSKELNG